MTDELTIHATTAVHAIEAPLPLPATFDHSAYYDVGLLRSFRFCEHLFHPQQEVTLRGDLAEQFRNNLAWAKLK